MKINYILIILLLLSGNFVFAGEEEQFSEAEKLYNENKYDEALKLYASLLNEDEISPSIFYNMGNCYFKQGDYVNALLYYEKSYKYAPGHDDVLMNISITREKLTDKSDEFDTGVSGWFYAVVNSRAADYWSYLSVMLSLIGSAFLILLFFTKAVSMKRMLLATSLISYLFAIVFVIFSYYQISHFNADDLALTGESGIEVKSEPDEDSKTVFIVPGGIKIKIISVRDDWSEIILNSNVGWVKSEELKKI